MSLRQPGRRRGALQLRFMAFGAVSMPRGSSRRLMILHHGLLRRDHRWSSDRDNPINMAITGEKGLIFHSIGQRLTRRDYADN
jgi:hypothetical protein